MQRVRFWCSCCFFFGPPPYASWPHCVLLPPPAASVNDEEQHVLVQYDLVQHVCADQEELYECTTNFYMWLYLVNCKGYNFFCGSNNNKSSSFFFKIKHFCHFFVVMWLIVLRSTIKAYYDYVRIKIALLALLKNMKVLVR